MARLGGHTFIWASEWTTGAARSIFPAAVEAGLGVIEIACSAPRRSMSARRWISPASTVSA